MKTILSLRYFKLYLYSLILTLVLPVNGVALVNVRNDAIFAVSRLHRAGVARYLPDDMRSLDATLAEAEQLNEKNANNLADKHFLLALQKAHVIESLLGLTHTPLLVIPESDIHKTDLQRESTFAFPEGKESEFGIPANEITTTKLIGGTGVYTVISGDTIRLVAAKLGITRQYLLKLNHLETSALLKKGQKLAYNNLKIIPQRLQEGIIVNIPDRTLYLFKQGNLIKSLPVALGVSIKNEKYVWQTPVGKFRVTAKQKDPTWYVPSSIKSEMEEKGKEIVSVVPPGPKNPLGKFAIKTSIPGILIHSTTRPGSIYSFASHGCIRVYPAQMEAFFNEVKIHTQGEIIYEPVKLAITEIGKIFLEVHNDIYKKSSNLEDDARKMLEKLKLNEQVDWKKFELVVKQKSGVAEDISL